MDVIDVLNSVSSAVTTTIVTGDGSQGPQGLQGAQGTSSGSTSGGTGSGAQGFQGPVGASSTVQGPQGPQGRQGLQGPQGNIGASSTVQGPQGPQGRQGLQGPQGNQGLQGATGITGTNVSSSAYQFNTSTASADPSIRRISGSNANLTLANSIYVNNINSNSVDMSSYYSSINIGDKLYLQAASDLTNFFMYTVNDINSLAGYFEFLVSFVTNGAATSYSSGEDILLAFALKGDIGNIGPQGLLGFQGPQGSIGPTGASSTVQGPQGRQGLQGPQGLQGNTGSAGNTGATGSVSAIVYSTTSTSYSIGTTQSAFIFNGGGTATWTLPALTTNLIFRVINAGSNIMSVNTNAAGNDIWDIQMGSSTSFVNIEANSDSSFVCDGTYFYFKAYV